MHTLGRAARKSAGLRHLVGHGDRHGNRAVRNRSSGDFDIAADHHRAGTCVDDHTGRGLARLHVDVFDHAHKRDPLADVHGRAHHDGYTVQRIGHIGAEFGIDSLHDAVGGGEVAFAQVQQHVVRLVKRIGHHTLYRGTARNARRGGHANRYLRARATRVNARRGECALSQGVNLPIHTAQAREQQVAPAQAGSRADGRHIDVDALARFGHAGQVGGDHHRRHIGQLIAAAGNGVAKFVNVIVLVQAHAVEQGFHALAGESGFFVARALQTHHQAVADQLVTAHGGHAGQVLDAVRMGSRKAASPQQGHQADESEKCVHGAWPVKRSCLKGHELKNAAGTPTGAAGGGLVANAAVADLGIGQAARKYGVIGCNVFWAHHA